MNIFGAFTFGSLIKTFLPGFVWLLAIVLLDNDIAQIFGRGETLWSFAQKHDQSALVLAIPISILLGLLSNILVFMGVLDRFVRHPVSEKDPRLKNLYEELRGRLRQKCCESLSDLDPQHEAAFNSYVDGEIVLLNIMGVEKLAYLREQYWYHLEFQLNLILSIAAVGSAVVFYSLLNFAIVVGLALAVGSLVAAKLIICGLLKAARKNYARHLAKMASAMAAALCTPNSSTPAG